MGHAYIGYYSAIKKGQIWVNWNKMNEPRTCYTSKSERESLQLKKKKKKYIYIYIYIQRIETTASIKSIITMY